MGFPYEEVGRQDSARMSGLHHPRGIVEEIPQLKITVPRRSLGWGDPKGNQRIRLLLCKAESVVDNLQKLIDWLDDVIGGENCDDGLGIALGNNRGAIANGIEGVASDRFPKKLRLGKAGKRPCDHLRMVLPGADEPILGGNQPLEAVESKLKQAFSADKWDKLFGKAGPAHRPKPRPGTTCNNQGVSHVEIFSLLKSSQIGARALGITLLIDRIDTRFDQGDFRFRLHPPRVAGNEQLFNPGEGSTERNPMRAENKAAGLMVFVENNIPDRLRSHHIRRNIATMLSLVHYLISC